MMPCVGHYGLRLHLSAHGAREAEGPLFQHYAEQGGHQGDEARLFKLLPFYATGYLL